MKKFLVLFIAVMLLLAFSTPVMARGGHGGHSSGGYHGGGHGGGYYGGYGYRGGGFWPGVIVGGIVGGALGYGVAPHYGYGYGYPPPPTCIGYIDRYDQWGRLVQVPVRVPCY